MIKSCSFRIYFIYLFFISVFLFFDIFFPSSHHHNSSLSVFIFLSSPAQPTFTHFIQSLANSVHTQNKIKLEERKKERKQKITSKSLAIVLIVGFFITFHSIFISFNAEISFIFFFLIFWFFLFEIIVFHSIQMTIFFVFSYLSYSRTKLLFFSSSVIINKFYFYPHKIETKKYGKTNQ